MTVVRNEWDNNWKHPICKRLLLLLLSSVRGGRRTTLALPTSLDSKEVTLVTEAVNHYKHEAFYHRYLALNCDLRKRSSSNLFEMLYIVIFLSNTNNIQNWKCQEVWQNEYGITDITKRHKIYLFPCEQVIDHTYLDHIYEKPVVCFKLISRHLVQSKMSLRHLVHTKRFLRFSPVWNHLA